MHAERWLAAAALAALVLGCEGGDAQTGGGSATPTDEQGSTAVERQDGPPKVVGEWAATDPRGSKVRFEFREDGTAVWIFDEQGREADRTEGRYTLRGSEPPYEIDIHDFDRGAMKGKRFEGIYEMRGDDRLKMQGKPGGPRPQAFGDQALEFRRQ